MRYSLPVKFIAIVLTALALTLSVLCALGIVQAEGFDLYTRNFDDWVHQRLEWQSYDLASGLAERYAVTNLSNCSTNSLRQMGYRRLLEDVLSWSGFSAEEFGYTITDRSGKVLESMKSDVEQTLVFEVTCSAEYPVLVINEAAVEWVYGKDYLRTESVDLEHYEDAVKVRYYDSPKYTVTLSFVQDAALNRYGSSVPLVRLLYTLRFTMMWVLALSLCLFGAGLVYLCGVAGKKGEDKAVCPSGLNLVPLDLYAGVGTGLGFLLASVAAAFIRSWITSGEDYNYGTFVMVALLLLGVSLVALGFVYALIAQLKLGDMYWWYHTVLHKLWCVVQAMLNRLPVIWKYLLMGTIMGTSVVLTAFWAWEGVVYPLVLVLVFCAAVVCYGAYAYATLLRGAQRMAAGDLQEKISTRFLSGSYVQCAEALNALADVATVAARNQMRSERMKTELITNVSHDIKTPLTSIINYVDLLQSASSKADSAQYLEVLGRQSQRLKKLIEDLMELSKASSGSMPVDLICLDATETLNQALGEFADKLEAAGLTMVYEPPAQPVTVLADGRLTWRVLSNLLTNTVKYALPGTRVYLDIRQAEDFTEISLKNISKEPLNVSADELTERFVRGDVSRNTEGSGLGLNIAKSLMELQKGALELTVDGDLFKVNLRFPNR